MVFFHFSAVLHRQEIKHLVTRNKADFQSSELVVASPVEMIDLLTSSA